MISGYHYFWKHRKNLIPPPSEWKSKPLDSAVSGDWRTLRSLARCRMSRLETPPGLKIKVFFEDGWGTSHIFRHVTGNTEIQWTEVSEMCEIHIKHAKDSSWIFEPRSLFNQCTWAEHVSHLRSFVQTRAERHRTRSFEGHRGMGRSNDSNVWCVFTWL